MKKTLILFLGFILIFNMNITSYATPAAIPYIPPSDITILKYIWNAFGITAPNISDDGEALDSYRDLFQKEFGSNWELVWNQCMKMCNNAKSSRLITINPALQSSLLNAMAYSLNNGFADPNSTWPGSTSCEAALPFLDSLYPGSFTLDGLIECARYNDADPNNCIVLLVQKPTYGTVLVLKKNYNYYWGGYSGNRMQLGFSYQSSWKLYHSGVYGVYEIWGTTYINYDKPVELYDLRNEISIGTSQTVTATNSAAVLTGTARALTVRSTLTADNTIDDTKPVVIPLPAVLPVPAVTQDELPAVLEDLQVIPVTDTQDVTTQLEDLKASSGSASDYALDLTAYFPFCIPFDIARLIQLFVADPVAPAFDFSIPIGIDENHQPIMYTFTVDLAMFDPVAYVVRIGMTIVFIIGLGMITRQVFLRG